jgi:catechol 2,3-dioxygenase-like lactoylglutathione lyase family enzyme
VTDEENLVLTETPFYAIIPTADLERARRFYERMLGLTPHRDLGQEVVYRAGSTYLDVYITEAAGSARHTLGSFVVDDIEATTNALRARGLTLEAYDLPGLKTIDGIARLGPEKVAWFKDPDGNILSLTQENA